MSLTNYPLTHRVLVCTRMDMFQDLGDVNTLSTHGTILPRLKMDLETASEKQAERIIKFLFPVFLHNLIRAPDFPLREKLSGALDQMEENIRESAQNAMVQELLTCGLQGKICDAAGLPENIDAKCAVALYLEREEWDTLYRTFYLRVLKGLIKGRQEIAKWLRSQEEQSAATA